MVTTEKIKMNRTGSLNQIEIANKILLLTKTYKHPLCLIRWADGAIKRVWSCHLVDDQLDKLIGIYDENAKAEDIVSDLESEFGFRKLKMSQSRRRLS